MSLKRFRIPLAASFVLLQCLAAAAPPATRPEKQEFMRFSQVDGGGARLETAVATFKNDAGVRVHLVAAVHVADRSYYETLDKTFAGYDALLYEMIKPKDMGAPLRGQRSSSMISLFQQKLKDILGLDFQLDDIDYTKPNFVHADLDAETFASMQEERGESLLGLMLKSAITQWAHEMDGKGAPQMNGFELLAALNSPDRARQLKLLLGRQFGDIEDQMSGLQGPDGSVLITERNKKALSVLSDEIAAGKKDIGIFYGAGHMNDMETRLEKMGFKPVAMDWVVAWDIPAGAPATAPATTRPADDAK